MVYEVLSVADCPAVIEGVVVVKEQVGTGSVWSVHEFVHVYPAGTHAVQSHCSFAIEEANHHDKLAILCLVSTTPSPQ